MSEKNMTRAFIGIESNRNPAAYMAAPIHALAQRVRVITISTIYQIVREQRINRPSFYTSVIEIETSLSPGTLKFQILHKIAVKLSRRRRRASKNALSPISLDLLLYGHLFLPHPEIVCSPFVAVPLKELAPDLMLPGTFITISALAASFPKIEMKPLKVCTSQLRRKVHLLPPACLHPSIKAQPINGSSPFEINQGSPPN